jgi:hypothetical protein
LLPLQLLLHWNDESLLLNHLELLWLLRFL